MKSIIIIIISYFSLISCAELQDSNNEDVQIANTGKVDEYMRALTELKQFNGVLLIEDSLGNVFSSAYNIQDEKLPSLSITVMHQFDLRSIAKLFAKASLVKLEHEGKLAFDQKLSDFLPDFPMGEEITIHHLMNHQSGLRRELSNYDGHSAQLSPEEVVNLIHQEQLEFEPGTETRYSNLGFQLLYKIIGDISGGTYAEYLRSNFFDPIGMINSGSHYLDPKAKLDNYAFGHSLIDMDSIYKVTEDNSDMQQGHIFSTVDDMKKFLDYISENQLYKALIEGDAISHAGGTKGKRAWVYYNPIEEYKIIFLANFDGIPFSTLTNDLIALMEGKEVKIPKEINRKSIEVDSSILQQYAGTYDFVDAGHIILTIKYENGELKAYQKGELAGALIPENDSTFFWDAKSNESFIFTKDMKGKRKALMDFQGVRWDGILIN